MRHIKTTISLLLVLAAIIMTSCHENTVPVRHSAFNANYLVGALPDANGIESISITTEYADKSTPETTSSYTFDIQGRLTSESTDHSQRSYSYTPDGHISTISHNDAVEIEYNPEGDLTHITITNEDTGNFPTEILYTYDEAGRVTEQRFTYDDYESITRYSYTSEGLPEAKYLYKPGEYSKTVYDEKGFPVTTETTDSIKGKTTYYDYTYKTDSEGNWIKEIVKNRNNSWSRGKNYSVTTRDITYYDSPYIIQPAEPVIKETVTDNTSSSARASRLISDKYIDDLKFRISMAPYTLGGASGIMSLVLIILVVAATIGAIWWGIVEWNIYSNLGGSPGKNGMRRMWMYNARPYLAVLYTMGCILAAFVASVIVLVIVGGAFWLLMWLIKGILWALYFVGWICLILGGLALLGKEGAGCLPLIIGILIVSCEDWIENAGETVVAWGENFMTSANFFGFGIGLFSEFWDVMLLIVLFPMAIFVAVAVVIIIFNLLLSGGEWVFTKIYNINRPCPQCGKHSDYDYLIDGTPHPVPLRPGLYGSFHQTHYNLFDEPEYRVPTMLLNGRDRLDRRCRSCGAIINTGGTHSVGTDVHIGLVGHVGAGKTYLIFSGLNELMKEYDKDIEQVDNADRNFDVNVKSQQIMARRDIQTDRRTSYRAVQLMFKRSNHLVPYHLHFYDVAGEQFTTNAALGDDAMRFYNNVQSIVVVIDPLMIDTQAPGVRASLKFEQWQKEKNPRPMRYNPADTLASLNVYLEKYGRSSRKIDLTFVCVKSDTGYFEAMNYPAEPSAEQIRDFMKNILGMTTLVNTGDTFKSVSFYATSVYSNNRSSLRELFKHLLRQRKIGL